MLENEIQDGRLIRIEENGKLSEGWYFVEEGGVWVHHINSAGLLRRRWIDAESDELEMMGRLALSFLVDADEEAPPCEPFRHVLGIEFRGKEIEGWYYIENDGVSVYYRSPTGVLRRNWAQVKYCDWHVMARIVLRELAELDAANSSLCVVENDRRSYELSDGHRQP
jgi:hypothetical protein